MPSKMHYFSNATPVQEINFHISKNMFFSCLALVTSIPLIGFPLLHYLSVSNELIQSYFAPLIFLGGSAHVASTLYFYADKESAKIVHGNLRRYLIAPVTLVVLFASILQFGSSKVANFVLFFYFCWQMHHYQRQNYGIVSFAAASSQIGPLPQRLKHTMNLAVLGGIFGVIGVFSTGEFNHGVIFADYVHILKKISVAIYTVVAILCISILFDKKIRSGSGWLMFYIVCSCFFYLPAIFYDNVLLAFLSYALAHGLQYLVFMAIVSAKSVNPVKGIVLIAVFAGGAGWALASFNQLGIGTDIWKAVFGAYLGLVASHFVIDGGIWRLREQKQRAFIKGRFSFLFKAS